MSRFLAAIARAHRDQLIGRPPRCASEPAMPGSSSTTPAPTVPRPAMPIFRGFSMVRYVVARSAARLQGVMLSPIPRSKDRWRDLGQE